MRLLVYALVLLPAFSLSTLAASLYSDGTSISQRDASSELTSRDPPGKDHCPFGQNSCGVFNHCCLAGYECVTDGLNVGCCLYGMKCYRPKGLSSCAFLGTRRCPGQNWCCPNGALCTSFGCQYDPNPKKGK